MRNFLKDNVLQAVFGAGIVFLSVAFGLIFYKLDHGSKFLILHFDAYRGIDLFGGVTALYQLWGVALCMAIVNLFLASALYVRDRFLAHTMGFATLFISGLLLIAVSVIILVN